MPAGRSGQIGFCRDPPSARPSARNGHIDLIADCGEHVHNWVMALAADLASLRNQMAQFPISYYFYMGEPQTALAGALPYL